MPVVRTGKQLWIPSKPGYNDIFAKYPEIFKISPLWFDFIILININYLY